MEEDTIEIENSKTGEKNTVKLSKGTGDFDSL